MIATDYANLIRERICSEISISPVNDSRFSVGIPLLYGDGDSCRIFVTAGAGGEYLLRDGGFVLSSSAIDGVDLLARGHVDRFRRISEFYGVKEINGELTMDADSNDLGDAVFVFTQACLELSRLGELPREVSRKAKAFNVRFRRDVEQSAEVARLERRWHDPSRDKAGVYRVDYRILAEDVNWLVFGTGTASKVWKAASAVQHYKFKKLAMRTVFAYGESAERNSEAFAMLADNADAKFSMQTERQRFRDFLRRI